MAETIFGDVSSNGWKIKGLLLGDIGTASVPEQGKVICTDDLYLQVPAGKQAFVTIDGVSAAISLVGHNHTGVYQPLDADLTAIGALSGTSGFLKKTAANTWSLDTGSYQPLDAGLTSLAGLTYASASFVKYTGADTFTLDTNTYSLSSHTHSYQPLDTGLTSLAGLTYASTSFVKMTGANTFALDTNAYSLSSHNHDADYLQLAGGTLTGNVTLSNSSLDAVFIINGLAGKYKQLRFNTGGVLRWLLYTGNDAESGSNTGSSFILSAYDDAGAGLGSVFSIPRATRVLNFTVRPTSVGNTIWDEGNLTFGTGATNMAAGNHTHSGVYQPADTQLTGLASLAWASGTPFVKMTAASTFALDTNTYSLSSHTHSYLATSGGTISGALTVTGTTTLQGDLVVDADAYGAAVPASGVTGQIFFKTS